MLSIEDSSYTGGQDRNLDSCCSFLSDELLPWSRLRESSRWAETRNFKFSLIDLLSMVVC